MDTNTMNRVFVLGATGEVGKELVNELVKSEKFVKVVLFGRRNVELAGEKFNKIEQKIIDFENLDANLFQDFDAGFCCLGTTKGKAGEAGFIKVDHDYVVNSAKLAKDAGCKQFHLVTAQNANKNSWFLYPKTKGRTEEDVINMGFDYLAIYRPALLLCERQESRPLEKVAQAMAGTLDRWGKISIPTITVAQAIVKNATKNHTNKVDIFENSKLFELAKE